MRSEDSTMLTIIICIAGGLAYFLATREKLKDEAVAGMGKWSFIIGLIGIVWQYGGMRVL